MKIIEYWVSSGKTIGELETNVTDVLKDGFQPYGCMSIYGCQLLQPMVKYETNCSHQYRVEGNPWDNMGHFIGPCVRCGEPQNAIDNTSTNE